MLPKCNSRVKTEVEGGLRSLTIAGNRYAALPTSSSPAQYPTCRLTPIDSEFPQWETSSAGRESVRPLATRSIRQCSTRMPHTGMNNFSLDHESFQKLLANAHAVQQSQMDSRSLSVVVELQRLMAHGDVDLDGSLHLIAHHTQGVAGATGVAIGLLKGNQLVYRAGCGNAATYVGRSMPASLVVPANGKANSEILRVENTET